MSSEYPPGGQKKPGFRQTMRNSYERFIDVVKRPLSPRPPSRQTDCLLAPAAQSHSQSLSRANSPSFISDPPPAEPEQQAISPPSGPSTQDPMPNAQTDVTPESEVTNNSTRNRLTTALCVLEGSVRSFPPLKAAVGELIGCLDVVHAAAANRRDYEQLVDEFQSMADILKPYAEELESEPRTGSIANVAQCIQRQVTEIKNQEERGTIGRLLSTTDDQEDVIRRYRRIEGLFRQLQCDLSMRTRSDVKKQLETTRLRGMSPVDDAWYNSSYSMTIKRHACTAETREAIHQALQEWTMKPGGANIYWMNGMAGTGKTTIAYSFCEWLKRTNRLGASFFCSRISATCRSLSQIVPTLAYQLARYSPAFRSALCAALNDNPDAGTLNVVQQFEMLINEPMLRAKDAIPEGVVVVIDALDECDDVYSVRLLLDLLLKFSQNLPLKFFVASRPEHAIRERMMSQGGASRSIVHLHDIEASIVEEDIKKFLIESLSAMEPRPSLKQIQMLAKRSRNLFIYAATVVRYIYPEDIHVDSNARLESMLEAISAPRAIAENRYEDLDRLYTTVLGAVFAARLSESEKESMRQVLWTVVCAKEPIRATTISLLASLTESQVWTALQSLRSVVHVPEDKSLISTLHASFPEYMLDNLRSHEFYCNRSISNETLAHRCFAVMQSELRFNICNLESSYQTDDQIKNMETRVARCISPTLSYACRYWSAHLSLSPAINNTRRMLLDLVHNRLLFWMEFLSLTSSIRLGAPMMSQAQTWLRQTDGDHDEIQKQVSDARNFITWFAANPCSQSTPHIYISALPLCAKSSWVYKHYRSHTRGLANITSSQRDEAVLAIWSTESEVFSVTISPEGDRIAFGHRDGSIHIYDAQTGAEVAGPIRAHTSPINSVAFSPNGSHIASGSYDRTVRIWDSYSGTSVSEPFNGHTGGVESVAFSPDGRRIVSGSHDHTVIVWDTLSGAILLGPLKGHTDLVMSAMFSPDGRLIASGSFDHTIRLWDANTGEPAAEPFMGHQVQIWSVAFSPDSTHLASGSSDRSIRIWDVRSGANVMSPLEHHTSSVISLAYSPDGAHIISGGGTGDRAVIVWDAVSGTVVAGPLRGHTSVIRAVMFTPDGTRAVSGSEDSTIRIWDVQTKDSATKQQIKHEAFVGAVAFSPDCTQFASFSSGGTLQVWDTLSGEVILRPSENHTAAELSAVNTVAFSPQGSHIAASGSDFTILVWDLRTGTTAPQPLKGHNKPVRCIVFSPDGSHLCSGSDDKAIIVWDINAGVPVNPPCKGHTGPVCSIAYSPDGAQVASGSDERTVRVWDPSTGSLLHTLSGHAGGVTSIAFSPSGNCIVSGGASGKLWGWNARSNKWESGKQSDPTSHPVSRVCFSPDGSCILAGSGSTIRMFDAQTMEVIHILELFTSYSEEETVCWVGFSPDGADILSASVRENSRKGDAQEPQPNIIRVWRPGAHDSLSTHSRSRYWSYESDGRILSPEGLVMWVPPDLLPLLKVESDSYYNPLVLLSDGIIDIGYKDMCIGKRWSECYTHKG